MLLLPRYARSAAKNLWHLGQPCMILIRQKRVLILRAQGLQTRLECLMETWNQSGMKGKVGSFQNPGVCQQAFPSFLPLPLPYFFSPGNSLPLNPTNTLATQGHRQPKLSLWGVITFLKKNSLCGTFTSWNKLSWHSYRCHLLLHNDLTRNVTLTFQHVEVLCYNGLNLQRFVWEKR